MPERGATGRRLMSFNDTFLLEALGDAIRWRLSDPRDLSRGTSLHSRRDHYDGWWPLPMADFLSTVLVVGRADLQIACEEARCPFWPDILSSLR
jgi:hypothetical protein